MANIKLVSTAPKSVPAQPKAAPKTAPKATPKQPEPKITEIVEDEDNISWDDDGSAEDDDDEDEYESEPYHECDEYADGIDWDDNAISDADSEGGSTPVQSSNSKPSGASCKTDID
ncbi:hypothetical protein WICPIJ_005116 [Wickerhamomyces pijperi]|uniref:Uncharacterized protein n=1 Tax=Wickerhamomyces pijperi TaxID=599730 RepID=A0A9P8TMN2_WICPI|nr:hypothetical protein WICPIJ_005116 [Wickerhamomyces pijperi]